MPPAATAMVLFGTTVSSYAFPAAIASAEEKESAWGERQFKSQHSQPRASVRIFIETGMSKWLCHLFVQSLYSLELLKLCSRQIQHII